MRHYSFAKATYSFVVLLLFNIAISWSQNIIVQGFVKDIYNRPLVGVSIKAKGTSPEVFTDTAGIYHIQASAKGKLLFSRKGYITQRVPVKNQHLINLFLLPEQKATDRDVNIGYGTAKQSETTQSIGSVNEKTIEQTRSSDIGQFLETIPGVEVIRAGGEIRLRIRGIHTFYGSSDPLIILDGSPYSGSLSDLNRNDIQSIDVLKDAAGTAIYGVQGGNGVVVITSKKGK